jgi:hypothetical protein
MTLLLWQFHCLHDANIVMTRFLSRSDRCQDPTVPRSNFYRDPTVVKIPMSSSHCCHDPNIMIHWSQDSNIFLKEEVIGK